MAHGCPEDPGATHYEGCPCHEEGWRLRLNAALADRDSWRYRAEQRYALRSELEQALGLASDSTYTDDGFQRALRRVQASNALAGAAEEALDYLGELLGERAWQNDHPATQRKYDDLLGTGDRLRAALKAYREG